MEKYKIEVYPARCRGGFGFPLIPAMIGDMEVTLTGQIDGSSITSKYGISYHDCQFTELYDKIYATLKSYQGRKARLKTKGENFPKSVLLEQNLTERMDPLAPAIFLIRD